MEKLDAHFPQFRTSRRVKDLAQKMADLDRRKLSDWLRMTIEEKVDVFEKGNKSDIKVTC